MMGKTMGGKTISSAVCLFVCWRGRSFLILLILDAEVWHQNATIGEDSSAAIDRSPICCSSQDEVALFRKTLNGRCAHSHRDSS
jgi:hypothetical protein